MKHSIIYYDEASEITDEMLEEISALVSVHPDCRCKVGRRSFYRRHEGKILLAMIVLILLGLYLILPYIPSILWWITTPLVHLMGGQ